MNKKALKITSLSTLALLAGTTLANAAVPANTIVIGNKAFDVMYLVSGQHDAEIQAALDATDASKIFYQLEGESQWTKLLDESVKLDNAGLAALIPTVTYYNASGATSQQNVNDGTLPATSGDLTISSVNFAPAQSVALNQSLFQVATVTLKAGDSDVTVNGIKLQRSGLSADSDVQGVSVWDGSERLNLPGILSLGNADIDFTNPLVIAKGQTKTLSVKVDLNSVTVGRQLIFSIPTGGVKTNATVAGTLPAVSPVYTTTNVALGTVQVAAGVSQPTGRIKPSSTQTTVGTYRLTAQTESIKLNRLTLTQDGSAGNEDIKNFKLYKGDTLIGSVDAMTNRKLNFTFDTPVELVNGVNNDFTLKADIVGGSGRTVNFGIDNRIDVEGVGETYGTTISAPAGFAAVAGSAGNLTIDQGSFLVSRDSSAPAAGNIGAGSLNTLFNAFKLEAVGENIQLRTINLTPTVAGGALTTDMTNLKVVVNDQTILQIQDPFTGVASGAATGTLSLSKPITVTPGTPIVVKIYADMKNTSVGTYQVGLAANGFSGAGLTSYDTNIATTNAGAITGNNLTIGALALNATFGPVGNTSVYSGQNDKTLTSFNFSHDIAEGVTLRQVTVTSSVGNPTDLTNARLTTADGTVVSDVIANYTSGSTFTLTNPINVAKGTTLQLNLVANKGTAALPGGATFYSFGVSAVSATTTSSGNTVNLGAVLANGGPHATYRSGSANLAASRPATSGVGSGNIAKGATDVNLGMFRLTETDLANDQGASVTYIDIDPNIAGTSNLGAIKNIRIVDMSGNVLGSKTNFDGLTTATRFNLSTPLSVGRNDYSEFKVLADIASNADDGMTASIALGNDVAGGTQVIGYKNATTGEDRTTAAPVNAYIQAGSAGVATFTVVPAVVNVASENITTTSYSDGVLSGSRIGSFTFTNNGSDPIELLSIELQDTRNVLGTTADMTIGIYRADNGNKVNTGNDAWTVGSTRYFAITPTKINPGTSKTFNVEIDNGTQINAKAVTLKEVSDNTTFRIAGDTSVYTVDDDALAQTVSFGGVAGAAIATPTAAAAVTNAAGGASILGAGTVTPANSLANMNGTFSVVVGASATAGAAGTYTADMSGWTGGTEAELVAWLNANVKNGATAITTFGTFSVDAGHHLVFTSTTAAATEIITAAGTGISGDATTAIEAVLGL